ncbi:AAA family ATPase [Phanerochaete sordida]|uniref:AAA family ATPase n=1 Tax=Phanerochaete sordida TaxID=48140 RepID=A0A9P3GRB7_9APHY|nr:AAA family ATPase [Phanerochaete sordida]
MSSFTAFLASQFGTPVPNPHLNLIQYAKAAYPQSQHVSVLYTLGYSAFPLSGYLEAVGVKPTVVEPETHSTLCYAEDTKTVYTKAVAGVTEFTHSGVAYRVYKASWSQDFRPHEFYHLVFAGADDSAGQAFAQAVFAWGQDLREQIWVFEGGQWDKSKQLYKAVQAASWDDIVLDEQFKEGLRRDTKTFFENKDAYASLNIAWKRGILLLGPPGNGKTESIKALLNENKHIAPLYVKSFTTCRGPEEGVQAIFEHARAHSPCILILEDLDAMLVPEVRSLFLNEMDGLADNEGILTIATTNHPERIDDSILNRPSRFDVKYDFTLPDAALRKTFAVKWLGKVNALAANTGVEFEDSEATAKVVAEKTDGWSYAILKELFVSFLLRMAHDKSLRRSGVDVPSEAVESVLVKQVDQLAAQIVKAKNESAESGVAKAGMDAALAAAMGSRQRKAVQDMMSGLRGNSGSFVKSGVDF